MPEVTDLASAWGHEGTRTNQGSGIIYIIEKPDRPHELSMCSALVAFFNRFCFLGKTS